MDFTVCLAGAHILSWRLPRRASQALPARQPSSFSDRGRSRSSGWNSPRGSPRPLRAPSRLSALRRCMCFSLVQGHPHSARSPFP